MATAKSKKGVSTEDKLRALYNLQLIDSRIDTIRTVRGELPFEVQDLEDETEGLATRLEKIETEKKSLDTEVSGKKNAITESNRITFEITENLSL
jgi:predicted  nucleic acid-binding Zn-ribbon protein